MFKSNSSLLVLSALVVAQGAYAAAPKSMTARAKETVTSSASSIATKGTELVKDKNSQTTAAGLLLSALALRGIDQATAKIGSAASTVWSYVPNAPAMPVANDEGYLATAKALIVAAKDNPGTTGIYATVAIASAYGIYTAGKGVYNFVFPATPAKK